MVAAPIPRLINILRSTLILMGDYADNRQVASMLLELKYNLVHSISELERLPESSTIPLRVHEDATGSMKYREAKKHEGGSPPDRAAWGIHPLVRFHKLCRILNCCDSMPDLGRVSS